MGLFGFGKKKRQSEEAAEAAAEENDKADEAISETAEAPAGGIQETILPEPSDEYDGRGDEHGPWDVDDENVPDYDEYLDMGAYYLPFLQGIELRVKANRATQQVLGTTITYGSSSVEIEAFAAPKTMGLWDDVRADLVELCFPELFFRGFLPGLGLPCPARWLPVLIGKPEVTRQLCGGFLFPQPVQGSYKINHIPICTTSEAVETLVQLHAGGLIVVERAASHPVSVYPDSVMLRSLSCRNGLLHSFKYIQINSSL